MIAVTIPIGNIAPGIRTLLTIDASDKIAIPHTADRGKKYRWSSPTNIRAICGPTIPIKPIVPTKETATA